MQKLLKHGVLKMCASNTEKKPHERLYAEVAQLEKQLEAKRQAAWESEKDYITVSQNVGNCTI